MKSFLIIGFICFATFQSFAQQNTIIWDEKQPLQWVDFSGPINDSSNFDAESFAEVKYNYQFITPTNFHFDVYANFNKGTSWCRRDYHSQALLKHEQLHFDIAALFARRLKEVFDHYQYSKDYRNEIQQIFEQKKTEYHAMQHQYDEETNHSLNKDRQKDWEKYIADQLSEMKFKFNYAKQ